MAWYRPLVIRRDSTRSSSAPGYRAVRRAAATVEFAVVAAFLGIVTVGMAEVGRAVMVKSILTDASRKGASTAVAANKTYSDIQNDVDDVLSTDQQLPATLANGKATLAVSVAAWNAATQTYGPDVVVNSSTFAPNQYDKVSVKVSVNASDVTWLFLNYTRGVIESETVVMMKE
jgi:Flp pilus assembly protein TadG